jgi:hypothetical protein
MAIRKEKIKQQYVAAVPGLLEPGEQPQMGFFTQSGPAPWIYALGGLISVLVAWAAGMGNYFVVLTDRRILFVRGSLMSNRPKGLAWADPRSRLAIHDVKSGKIWTRLRYTPQGHRAMRFNVHRIWKPELESFLQQLAPVG